jgi:hypothetical protein
MARHKKVGKHAKLKMVHGAAHSFGKKHRAKKGGRRKRSHKK